MTKNSFIAAIQTFADISSDGVLLFNLKSRKIEYVNRALAQLFDISHESFTHQAEFFVNHVVDNDMEHLQMHYDILVSEGIVENVEFSTQSHEGVVRSISANCYVIESGKYVIGFFKDITVLREYENYIVDYGAKKNTLLDMVTHNLSGPLAISRNLLDSLERAVALQEIDENIQAHITLVKENTRHCIELVTEFLEEEHLVSQQISVKKSRFELFAKLNTILERFRKAYPDFTFNVTSNVQTLNVSLDDVKFLQVVNNLVSNALKWSQTKSQVDIRVIDKEETFTISVVDTGVGVPEHLQRFLFDKNSRASREGLRGEKSIGIGLYIVKKLVQLMEGTVTFESREGKGSTFTLEFKKNDVAEGINSHSSSNTTEK
ncbi:MAG TPA: PAS domain-containing sensor histidine kinase [Chryseosolibacter sp.]